MWRSYVTSETVLHTYYTYYNYIYFSFTFTTFFLQILFFWFSLNFSYFYYYFDKNMLQSKNTLPCSHEKENFQCFTFTNNNLSAYQDIIPLSFVFLNIHKTLPSVCLSCSVNILSVNYCFSLVILSLERIHTGRFKI